MIYETRVLSLIVKPKGEPIFGDRATTVRIDDEAGGCFVAITQDGQRVCIDQAEWPAVRAAINRLCREIAKMEENDDRQY